MDKDAEIRSREATRRKALWALAGVRPGDVKALEILKILDSVEAAELADAFLITKILDVDEVLVLVPAEDHTIGIRIIREHDIPQPWRARFLCASLGSTRVEAGPYACDWEKFLSDWTEEMAHLAMHRRLGRALSR